jgi:hypothetical protein
MNAGRVAKLIVGALLIALFVWFARHTYWADDELPLPLTGEAARNPFYAAQHFTTALRARTDWSTKLDTSNSHAIIVLSSWNWDLIRARREQIEHWVDSGGRLLVDRSLITGSDDFERWSGVSRLDRPRTKLAIYPRSGSSIGQVKAAPQCFTLQEFAAHSYDESGDHYSVCELDTGTSLRSSRNSVWGLGGESGIQAVRVPIGRGSVTVINGTPFTFRSLLDDENAALFVTATQLRGADVLHFVSEQDQPPLLQLTWRYGAPVVVLALVLVALALWRSGARFGPLAAAPQTARRSLAEQIRGTGQFALRVGAGESLHAAAVRALKEAASRHILAYTRLESAERMAALARVTGLDADALSAAVNYSGARRSNELRGAIALVEAARRRILENTG